MPDQPQADQREEKGGVAIQKQEPDAKAEPPAPLSLLRR
jgi:hypothetical protein